MQLGGNPSSYTYTEIDSQQNSQGDLMLTFPLLPHPRQCLQHLPFLFLPHTHPSTCLPAYLSLFLPLTAALLTNPSFSIPLPHLQLSQFTFSPPLAEPFLHPIFKASSMLSSACLSQLISVNSGTPSSA